MKEILFVNQFQRTVGAKIKVDILKGIGVPKILLNNRELAIDYIAGIPFLNIVNTYTLKISSNYNISKEHFINFWMRANGYKAEKRKDLETIWENSIYSENDCVGMFPIWQILNRGVITVESLENAIFKACELENEF